MAVRVQRIATVSVRRAWRRVPGHKSAGRVARTTARIVAQNLVFSYGPQIVVDETLKHKHLTFSLMGDELFQTACSTAVATAFYHSFLVVRKNKFL